MGLKLRSMGCVTFLVMVVAMLAQVTTMDVTKIALAQGINKYVIIVYSYALSTLLLLPCSFIIHRSDRTPVTFSLLCCFFLISVFGSASQIFGIIGLQYSSPTLGTALLNLIPGFTFILAVIFRLEKLDLRSNSGIAKSFGTIVSISGAFVVTFYKGPKLLGSPSHLHSPQLIWIIGGFSLACQALMLSSLYILQALVMKKFPAVLIILCYDFFFSTISSGIIALVLVKDPKAWKLRLDTGLFAILYTAVIGFAFRISLEAWCLRRSGPLYVSMFKPLAIVFAVAIDATFLRDIVSLGSLIGAIIIVAGFYMVLWGKAKEDSRAVNSETSAESVPLLRNRSIEDI